jgi:DNA helicase INO80
MILDEAQNIKNSASVRFSVFSAATGSSSLVHHTEFNAGYVHRLWGSTHCITELWAPLHFIMPSLFDSHDEFDEWFSETSRMQRRIKVANSTNTNFAVHMILKPFMLRLVKRHVQNELSEKVLGFHTC